MARGTRGAARGNTRCYEIPTCHYSAMAEAIRLKLDILLGTHQTYQGGCADCAQIRPAVRSRSDRLTSTTRWECQHVLTCALRFFDHPRSALADDILTVAVELRIVNFDF